MIRPTYLEIELHKIIQNAKFLRSLSSNDFFCPMIKADAYGHGAYAVAHALRDADIQFFGVALSEEAIDLRKLGITKPELLVFSVMNEKSVRAAEDFNLTPVIIRLEDLLLLEKELKKPMAVHMKLQTGMQRLGLDEPEYKEALKILSKSRKIKLQGLCTHLPNAEDFLSNSSTTEKSLSYFDQLCQLHSEVDFYHALNSTALLLGAQKKSPWISRFGARPGIALYGAAESDGLQEAMTLKTQIIQLHDVDVGQGVSYGHIWRAERKSLIGVLAVGYADGVRRGLTGQLNVNVNGQILPTVGRICMDYIMVDLTDVGLEKSELLNKEVKLLDASADGMNTTSWAKKLNTISYEVMTGFGKRLPREYL